MADGREAWAAWRVARAEALAAPDSWLGLVGLYWLKEGGNAVGSDPASVVVLPEGAAQIGHLECSGSGIVWWPLAGESRMLQTDAGGTPTIVELGRYAFFVIEREGRLAVRLRDREWGLRQAFAVIETLAYDPAWRLEAEWKPLDPPRVMEVPNVAGDLKPVSVAWQAAFKVGEQTVTLLPMSVSESGVFFAFRDSTSGRTSYGAGRFLNADAPVGGRIILDFNFACNPPCAFTPFATCPLPPPQNWLPFAIEAGELKYAAH